MGGIFSPLLFQKNLSSLISIPEVRIYFSGIFFWGLVVWIKKGSSAMFLVFTETQKLQKAQKALQKKRRLLFCKTCGKRISDMRYLTSVDGGSPNHVFRNPNGDLYEIITLSECKGLQETSPPILEET